MNSSRPYLVRALIDWIVDNGCTPYLVLTTGIDGVNVPMEHVSDQKIVLNVSGTAIRNFSLDNETIAFDSRFKGENFRITAPIGAVIGVYAKESGQGMAFEPEPPEPRGDDDRGSKNDDGDDDLDGRGKGKGPHLKLV